MKVVILGKGVMLANLIEGTIQSGAEIVGVMRYEKMTHTPLQLLFHDFFSTSPELTLIKKYHLHEINAKSANSKEFRRELLRLNADVLLVGTWREKIQKATYDIPTLASINVHPSLLPAYRGPNPYMQTIKHGEKFSGVTFHLIDQNLDTGAILAQKKVEILNCDTGKELREKTVYAARLLLPELLNRLENGLIQPIRQNEKLASYYPNISPDEIMLNFREKTAQEIHNHIRALHPWLPCYIQYGKNFYIPDPYRLKIVPQTHASAGAILARKQNSITVVCKDGNALEMSNLKKYHHKIFK